MAVLLTTYTMEHDSECSLSNNFDLPGSHGVRTSDLGGK